MARKSADSLSDSAYMGNSDSAQDSFISARSLIRAGFLRPDSARDAIESILKSCECISYEILFNCLNVVEDPDAAILSLRDLANIYPDVIKD
ncbi:hypothetical protein, partial [Gardnerella vaginalis]|uniref:hypothetical protein n=1 Tax=Gardnerella vaginalis TaxID=2702 RepID=UPI0018C53FE5